jgi:hypothetical protein
MGRADPKAILGTPRFSDKILEFVEPPHRYRETVAPGRAIQRSLKLAPDDAECF